MRMIGVDVGGTFTDAVVYDRNSGELSWSKASTTPQRPSDGVLAAIDSDGLGLGNVYRFVHGTTIGTNAFLERKGTPVWMVTTQGFGDTLEIARTNRTVLYDITTLKAPPLVDRRHVFEVDERLYADGSVARALDPERIVAVAERLKGLKPQALAVCFLHSYAAPDHENAAVEVLRAELPGWFVSASSDVLPEMREYERFNTTALNCYIGPVTAGYLDTLARELKAREYQARVFIMISSGGVVTAERAARYPVQTVLSGPAGGVAAAQYFGGLLGLEDLITYDMGGTSTDVCLIDGLQAPVTTDQYIEDYPVRTPQIDIHTVGAGGGSIAWVDTGDILKVGPKSAGAAPGPASYGRGGTEATVTDANLLLGRLSDDLKLAQSFALQRAPAEEAVARVAARFEGLEPGDAAEGIVRIAVARMVSAIKEISVSRGYDPRDFVLVAYGGAGPLHAAFIAEEFDMEHVLVPPSPGNFSAFGALISDVRHEHVRTHVADLSATDADTIDSHFDALERRAVSEMEADGMDGDKITSARSAGMRYVGQSWDLIVSLPARPKDTGQLADWFHEAHERRFGYRMDGEVEIVSLRVSVLGEVEKPELPRWSQDGSMGDARKGRRPVRFAGETLVVEVFDRMALPGASRIAGPAIIEEMGSVTVVPPGWSAEMGDYGELHLRRQSA